MRYVTLGPASRSAGTTPPGATQFTAETTQAASANFVPESERRGGAPVFRAAAGRDHRPADGSATTGISRDDDARRAHPKTPDIGRLASEVYGRIKRQLAVERERRGFV